MVTAEPTFNSRATTSSRSLHIDLGGSAIPPVLRKLTSASPPSETIIERTSATMETRPSRSWALLDRLTICAPQKDFRADELYEFHKKPTRIETLTSCLREIDQSEWRQAFKSFIYLIIGAKRRVEGLGLKLKSLAQLSANERQGLKEKLQSTPQQDKDWKKKLGLAAIIGKLEVGSSAHRYNEQTETQRSDVINYLKKTARTGDIVFFSTGGKRERVDTELTEILMRIKSSKKDEPETFPFVHVGLVTADGRVAHMTSKGLLIDNWEKLISKYRPYETLALSRLSANQTNCDQLASTACSFCKDKRYNSTWPLRDFLKRVIFKTSPKDNSATDNAIVCIDLITEAAKILAARNICFDPLISVAKNALDLFELKNLKILAAFHIDPESN